MPPRRLSPEDPREWLNRARSNLARAKSGADSPEVYLEDLCFDAQQAAEKAIKAVLQHLGEDLPKVHDLASLLTRVERRGRDVPERVKKAAVLSDYAVEARYPGPTEPVEQDEYEKAVAAAAAVVEWAEEIVGAGEE